MSEQQNLDIVRRGYEAFGKGDIQGLLALFDAGIDWISPGGPELPTAGHHKGLQAVADYLQTLAAMVDIQRLETREFFVQGDRVVVLGDSTHRVRATGKTLEFRFVHSFTLRDGKLVGFEEIGDMSAHSAELRQAQAGVTGS